MSSRRRQRFAALVPLLALLVTLFPFQPPQAQAALPDPIAQQPVVRSTLNQASEDAELVRATLKHPVQEDVFYFVLPDRFQNGDTTNDRGGSASTDPLQNGFKPDDKGYYHGGDLKGLLDQIDYIQNLGVTAIWMTPIFKNRAVQCGADVTIAGCSAGYHGYWITDFTQLDPHLGTNAELGQLVDEAHKRGIKVFFDIITNHTADVIDYEEKTYDYRNKTNYPYKDADGNVFDDKQYAGTDTFPPLDVETSFPYTPVFRNEADSSVKVPAWLNDPRYYHNRGNSTFSGESSEYGDFFGLDDLWTEQPAVVDGMVDIYKTWISEYGVDGFRIDTVKHVNMEFWQKWSPAVLGHAVSQGNSDFFMYGEVFDGNPEFMSRYTTEGNLPATLDFGFQGQTRGFASQGGNTNNLRDFFAKDDYYTDADSNAYHLPTFLGNHDMGRLGFFMKQDNPGAPDGEMLARSQLAHSLMFFARGMPVIYYGDEQGFVGDGGDKDARQDMMPSQVGSYNDDDLIGTNATTAQANFDQNHPLYQSFQNYAEIRAANKALQYGAQIHRYSTDGAGVYAFSRIDRDEKVEYVLAFNNSETAQSVTFNTYTPNGVFAPVAGGNASVTATAAGQVTVNVPALGFAIFKADRAIPASTAAPQISISAPAAGTLVNGRVEVGATLERDQFAEVTFAVQANDGEYEVIGTDNNAPYRVFYDTTDLPAGTQLTFKAIANDLNNHLASITTTAQVGDPDDGDVVQPNSVTIAGSLQSELGCPEDWNPACDATNLTYDSNDTVWQRQFTVPAGEYEYKAALNGTWDENYGKNAQPNGANIALNLGEERAVKFYYDRRTNWVTDNVNSVIATVPGSFQSELGCSDDWSPDCLRSWLQDPDGDGMYSFTTNKIPAGSYEAKVAHNESWDENYGAGGTPNGDNIKFDVPDGVSVTFTYDPSTHVLTITAGETCDTDYQYAVIHYQRPDGNYEGWGLHLWGDAIDPGEVTTWEAPKQINGEDDYGVFWFVKLQDASQPVNFIIHKGDEKDPGPDQSFVPADSPEVWIKSGDETIYTEQAAAQGYVTVHYQRPDGEYADWGLHLWGDAIADGVTTDWAAPRQRDGVDAWGAYFNVPIKDAAQPVNFIVHRPSGDEVPATREPGGDRNFVPNDTAAIWLNAGDETVYTSRGAADNIAIIHYHRPAGDYGNYTSDNFNDYWSLYTWTGAQSPSPSWAESQKPTGEDRFGVYWEVPLAEGANALNYIIHKGDEKDQPEDQELDIQTYGNEVWIVQGTPGYLLPIVNECNGGDRPGGNLREAAAHWVDQNTILWNTEVDPARTYRLHYAPTGGITLDNGTISGGQSVTLTYDPNGIADAVREKFPHLASYSAFKLNGATREPIADMLKGQLALSATGATGVVVDAAGVQIPGVLDALYTYTGQLGVVYGSGQFNTSVQLNLWAPTAKSVKLHVFDTSTTPTPTVYPMTWNAATGVWSAQGNVTWTNKFYLYEVEVYVHSTGQVERNMVTDPYSFSLSTNSTRSQIVNLNDPRLKPNGWDKLQKPALVAPENISLYELHVRDFSVYDQTVPQQYRGTYKAFTQQNSNGMKHLRGLAQAGLTHVHLLPVFDIATIEEDRSKQQQPNQQILESGGPASEQQQAEIGRVRGQDGYNWGYDPLHYTAPEGSYATNPDGVTRIIEFREMVQSLNGNGLRVVMDVVYNHTNSSGQDPKSVLDRVVPGYYHRLNAETGAVETSTCCQNTATEHNMMEKLMIDSVTTWTTAYKVDAFRFDLMGHHMKRNMVKLRETLNALNQTNSGVNGKSVYIYGEGWNFGEVANNARGVNATQANMAGTGIGTFNDRLRDAVRGGGPFDSGEALIRNQGFINGLFYDPNALNDGYAAERERLLLSSDQIKVGLTGNLRDYKFVDRTGATVTGAQVDYNGSPTGYTLDPQESITYVEAHDNQTLYDNNVYKAPRDTTMVERVRMQNLGISIASMAQGVSFFHAGQDMLRSKSLDRDSYDSGDWFNRLDFSYNTNNFGVGLPPAWANEENWPIMRELLADPTLKAQRPDILRAVEHMREMMRVRASSPLFHLQTAADVQQRVSFLNGGPNQVPGMIVMRLDDTVGTNLDKQHAQIVVLFNATDEAQTFGTDAFTNVKMSLHPELAKGSDPVVRTSSYNAQTGTFNIPPRTTAVFVVYEQGAPPPRGPNSIFLPQVILNKDQ